MRFPDIFQTLLLIFLLVVIHWLLNRCVPLAEQDNLKALIVSLIKVVLIFIGVSMLSKQRSIDPQDVKIKRINLSLCLISVCVGILLVFNPILGSISFFKQEDIMKIADSVITRSVDIFVFLNLVIVVPFFEELFFRGIIFSGLKNNYNVVFALILSSILFGVLHIDVVGSTVFGLWLGWIFFKTNNISLCIVVHSVCNLISFFFRFIAKDDQGQYVFNYIGENAIVISIIMFVFAVVLFYFSSKKFESASRALDEQS